jgi:hypothetical protein
MVDSQSAFKLLFFDLPTYPQLAHFPPLPPAQQKTAGVAQFSAVCSPYLEFNRKPLSFQYNEAIRIEV